MRKPNKSAGVLLGDVLLGFLVLLALHADNGGKDADAFGSRIHGAAKVLPRPKPGNAGCGGHLPRNLQHVPKAVVVKAAHRGEVVGEGVGVSGLQLLNQELDVGGDEFLFGVGLLAVDGGGVLWCSWCLLLGFGCCTFRVETRHATCRTPPGEGGGSKAQGEGISPPLEREPEAGRKGRSAAEVCTSEARKIGETPCAARSGQSP